MREEQQFIEDLKEENLHLTTILSNDKEFTDDETITCIEKSLRNIKDLRREYKAFIKETAKR